MSPETGLSANSPWPAVLPGLGACPEVGQEPAQVPQGNNGMEAAPINFFLNFEDEKHYGKQKTVSQSVLRSFQPI